MRKNISNKILVLVLGFLLLFSLGGCGFIGTTQPVSTQEVNYSLDFSYYDNYTYDLQNGGYENNINFACTSKENVYGDTLILNSLGYANYALFWTSNNYYIGYYAIEGQITSYSKYLGDITTLSFQVPEGTNKIAFIVDKNGVNGYMKLTGTTYTDQSLAYIHDNPNNSTYPIYSIDDNISVVSGYSGLTYRDVFGDSEFGTGKTNLVNNGNVQLISYGDNTQYYIRNYYNTIDIFLNHKYYISYDYDIYFPSLLGQSTFEQISVGINANIGGFNFNLSSNYYKGNNSFIFDNIYGNYTTSLRLYASNNASYNFLAENYLKTNNYMFFDLTDLFGSGNEPTKQQFETMLAEYKRIMNNANYDNSGDGINDTITLSNLDSGLTTVNNLAYDQSTLTSANFPFNVDYDNLVLNGNMATDSNSDGLADYISTAPTTINNSYIDNNGQYFNVITPTTTIGLIMTNSGENLYQNHTYYISFKISNWDVIGTSQLRVIFGDSYDTSHYFVSPNGVISFIETKLTDTYLRLRFYAQGTTVSGGFSLDNINVFDITNYNANYTDNYKSLRNNYVDDTVHLGASSYTTYSSVANGTKVTTITTGFPIEHTFYINSTSYVVGDNYVIYFSDLAPLFNSNSIDYNNINAIQIEVQQYNTTTSSYETIANNISNLTHTYVSFTPTDYDGTHQLKFLFTFVDTSNNTSFIADGTEYIVLENPFLVDVTEYIKQIYDYNINYFNYYGSILDTPQPYSTTYINSYYDYQVTDLGFVFGNQVIFNFVIDLGIGSSYISQENYQKYIDIYYNDDYNGTTNFAYNNLFVSYDSLNLYDIRYLIIPQFTDYSQLLDENNIQISNILNLYWDYKNGVDRYEWYTIYGITTYNYNDYLTLYSNELNETTNTLSNLQSLTVNGNRFQNIEITPNIENGINNFVDSFNISQTSMQMIIMGFIFIISVGALLLFKANIYITLLTLVPEISLFILLDWLVGWFAILLVGILFIFVVIKILTNKI